MHNTDRAHLENGWRYLCPSRDNPSKHTYFIFFIYRLQKNQKNTFFALIQASGESEERRSRCIIVSQVPQTPIVLHGSHLRVMVKSSAIRSPDARSWDCITEQNREDLIIVEVVFRFVEGCLVSSDFQVVF
jgi:hypothetical protein